MFDFARAQPIVPTSLVDERMCGGVPVQTYGNEVVFKRELEVGQMIYIWLENYVDVDPEDPDIPIRQLRVGPTCAESVEQVIQCHDDDTVQVIFSVSNVVS